MKGYRKILYFGLGIGMTSPLLALVVSGHIISLATVAFSLVFFDLILNKKPGRVINDKPLHKQYFNYWMYISIASSIFGFIYFIGINEEYAYSALSSLPKIFFYLLLFYLFAHDANGQEKMEYAFSGLKYGILINLVWTIIDASLFYMIGESLTNNVFASYIVAADLANGQCSTIEGFSIRSAGLNVDMATIGQFAVSAVVYSFLYNKKWLTLVGVLACFASVSFIGIVGVFIAFVWQYMFRKEAKNRILKLCVVSALAIYAVHFFYNTNNEIITGMRTAVELRAEAKKGDDHSASLRKLVIMKFPACVAHMPTSLFIGTGYFSAVYPYYKEGLEYRDFNIRNPKPTAMENTFVQYFFDLGLWGLLFFCLMIFKIYKLSYREFMLEKNEFYALLFAYIFGAFFDYLFYHNILYSVDIMVFIASALYLRRTKPLLNNSNNITIQNYE